MANTNINIRMDADLKRQFEAFCADMGMTMTTAFNVFARKAVREYRIPFEISGAACRPADSSGGPGPSRGDNPAAASYRGGRSGSAGPGAGAKARVV